MKEILTYLCVMLLIAGGITGVGMLTAQDSSAVVIDGSSDDLPIPQEGIATGNAPPQATTTLVYYNRGRCANGVCSVPSDQSTSPVAQPVKTPLRERPIIKAKPKPLRAVAQRLRRK